MRRALLLAALLFGSATANAEIVTFDGIPNGYSPTPMTTYVEGDVTVTSLYGNFWGLPDGALHMDPMDFFNSFGNAAYDFTLAGGAFDLTSFDIVENQGGWIWLYGFGAEGNLLTSMSTNALGSVNVVGFEDIHSLRIVNVGSHLSVDNFNLVSAIPELATWLMMMLGFGGIGLALRHSRRAALNAA
jgi:hypothetical protein